MHALLLDRNYMALSVVGWKKAIKLSTVGKAEVIEEHIDKELHSEKLIIKAPSVIRLINYTPFKASTENKVKFNRVNVLIRDSFICQYCGIKITKANGTIDHVVPKYLGGLSTYENTVACCKQCNKYKGNLTLTKAGMSLHSKPRRPTFWELYIKSLENVPIEWKKYLLGHS